MERNKKKGKKAEMGDEEKANLTADVAQGMEGKFSQKARRSAVQPPRDGRAYGI